MCTRNYALAIASASFPLGPFKGQPLGPLKGLPKGPLRAPLRALIRAPHKNGHISTNFQRQKLSIAVSEPAH